MNLRRFIKLLCLLISTCPSISGTAQVTISGKVVSVSGAGIPFAHVKYLPGEKMPASTFVIAENDGSFKLMIAERKAGAILDISSLGYRSRQIYLSELKQLRDLVCVLQEDTSSLPAIVITANPSIEISKDTISFSVDAFKTGQERNIGDLLSSLPGFNVSESGRITFNGESINKILFENDDLTGKNYAQFIKSLSTNGIEKVQLYQKFTDKENIQSAFNQTQKAVNFKFKKSFLLRPFGSLDGAIGVPRTKYDVNAQELLLSKKTKLIAIQTLNSVGSLNPIESNNQRVNEEEVDQDNLAVPIVRLDNLFTENDSKMRSPLSNLISGNHSSLWTVNLRSAPSKKFILKTGLQYMSDRFSKQLRTGNRYLVDPPFTVHRFQTTNIDDRYFRGSLSANYLLSAKDQLVFILTKQHASSDYYSADSIGVNPYAQNHTGKEKHIAGRITYNHLFDSSKILTAYIQHQTGSTTGDLVLAPSAFNDFFFRPNNFLQLQQVETQNIQRSMFDIEFSKKKRNILFKAGAYFSYTEVWVNNNIMARTSNNDEKMVLPDSTNNLAYRTLTGGFKLSETFFFGNKSSLTTSLNGFGFEQRLFNTNANTHLRSQNWLLSPGINIIVELTDKSKISATASMNNRTPEIQDMASGFIISGLTLLRRGVDTITNGQSKSVSLSFSHIDLYKKRLFFFATAMYQRSPQLYIMDQAPGAQYSIQQHFVTDQNMDLGSLILRLDKFFLSNALKVSPYGNFIKSSSYGMLNQQLSNNRFSNTRLGVDLSLSFAKRLRLLMGASFNKHVQSASAPTRTSSAIGSQVNARLYWKISESLYLNCGMVRESMKTSDRPSVSRTPVDLRLTFQSKNEKISAGIDIRNMLNQNTFSYAVLSPFVNSVSSYQLLPRIAMASLTYKF